MIHPLPLIVGLALAAGAVAPVVAPVIAPALAPALAQNAQNPPPPPSNAPSPAEKTPLPTTTLPDPAAKSDSGTAMPAPEKSLAPPVPPCAPPAGAPAPPARQTLVPNPGTPDDVDAVTLPAKPAAILSGRTTWEAAVPSLKAAFARIEGALAKAGVAPTGRPLAVFTKTEEDGFQYEAMIPIAQVPAQEQASAQPQPGTPPAPTEADGVRYGTTPSGRALRYRHSGAYDGIDGTYETLTAYLDAKDIAVQDQFVEEYLTDLSEAADERLDINIYALPKP